MLTTKEFTFGRDGIIVLLCRVTSKKLLSIWKMCIAHARRKHTAKPRDWDAMAILIPVLTEVVA